jgi:hypothetical protein
MTSRRRVTSPDRRQALFRGEFMAQFRSNKRYKEGITQQDLRPLWLATGLEDHGFPLDLIPLDLIVAIQYGPRVARQWQTTGQLQPVPYDDAAEETDRQELEERYGITPSTEIKHYLDELVRVVEQVLRVTSRGKPSWWVTQELHRDVIRIPGKWIDLVDWARMHPASLEVELEWRVKVNTFGVYVTVIDRATNEVRKLDLPTPSSDPLSTFRDWNYLRAVTEDLVAQTQAHFKQHYAREGWRRNAPADEQKLLEDLPALAQWYFAKDQPTCRKARRRLKVLAQKELGLDPPPTDQKLPPRPATFFARLSAQAAYSGEQALVIESGEG